MEAKSQEQRSASWRSDLMVSSQFMSQGLRSIRADRRSSVRVRRPKTGCSSSKTGRRREKILSHSAFLYGDCLWIAWRPVNWTDSYWSDEVLKRGAKAVSLVFMFHEVFLLSRMCHDFVVSETHTSTSVWKPLPSLLCLENSMHSSSLDVTFSERPLLIFPV